MMDDYAAGISKKSARFPRNDDKCVFYSSPHSLCFTFHELCAAFINFGIVGVLSQKNVSKYRTDKR